MDRGKGHSTSQGSVASGLRAWLGSTVLTEDQSGSISNEIPVSQDVIPGSELGCHCETNYQLVLDGGRDEEESAIFGYFL